MFKFELLLFKFNDFTKCFIIIVANFRTILRLFRTISGESACAIQKMLSGNNLVHKILKLCIICYCVRPNKYLLLSYSKCKMSQINCGPLLFGWSWTFKRITVSGPVSVPLSSSLPGCLPISDCRCFRRHQIRLQLETKAHFFSCLKRSIREWQSWRHFQQMKQVNFSNPCKSWL